MHSSERQYQEDQQQGNSAVWLQPAQLGILLDEAERLGCEPVGLLSGIHPGSVVELLSAWLSDCASVELGRELVAGQQTEDFEKGGLAVVPFVAAWSAEFLGYFGVEAERKPAQCVVFAEYLVGALAEWVSVGCKVLVWRSSDQAADLAV